MSWPTRTSCVIILVIAGGLLSNGPTLSVNGQSTSSPSVPPASIISQSVYSQHTSTATETAQSVDGMHVLSSMLPSGIQQIVVLDPAEKSMAVYHVEPLHGKIQLKSVRRVFWDLRMEQFNGQSPLPSELRQVQP